MTKASEVGARFHTWAEENGYLANDGIDGPGARKSLSSVFPQSVDTDVERAADQLIARLQVVAVFHDEASNSVTVCTKGAVPSTKGKLLPHGLEGVNVHWIGSCQVQNNPPPVPTQPPSAKRAYVHNGSLSCGSSVSPAHVIGAGTMGCLVRDGQGKLYGLSNNHVTGGCNHMEAGMPILCPSGFDSSADARHPVPRAIGRHSRSIPILSGDPKIVQPQKHDAAIFEILEQDLVSSQQGDSSIATYDTPSRLAFPNRGTRVKKVGRTTGLTHGTVVGSLSAPLMVPYSADRFKAQVYVTGAVAIEGDNGETFSEPGDSGSLVVSEDGSVAIGLIVAGMNRLSIVLPLEETLNEFGVTLVSAYRT
ncbi:hypothetical protein [Bosea sp. 2RAB26]|uniref:hypothetical protein n=1 Tax=Bosea sp. 2RAB26 TaxID=3237476 RepID=UPI003F92F278